MERFPKGNCFGGNGVHMRSTLQSGKYRFIDLLGNLLIFSHQNQPAARTAQCLMCSRGDYIKTVVKRVFRNSAGNQPRNMRHVRNRIGTHLTRNIHKLLILKLTRVCGKSCKNDFWLVFQRNLPQLIVVNLSGSNIFHFVAHKVEHFVDARGGVTVG